MSTKVQLKAFIKDKLSHDRRWQVKGLLAIYDHQTNEEQQLKTTNRFNGVGFTGSDARILSSLATFYQRNKYLSEKQIAILSRKMPKYWQQILNISNIDKLNAIINQPH